MRLLKVMLVLCVLFIFIPRVKSQPASLGAAMQAAVIDSITRLVNRYYVYPEKALLITSHIRQRFEQGAYDTIKAAAQLADLVTKDIRSIQPDHHLVIRYDPSLEKRILDFVATGKKDQADLEKERKENFFFRKAEILKGNIGYIVFTNFADTGELSRKTVRAALQFVANTDALVLDLRNNFGGSGAMYGEIADYFYRVPQYAGRTYNRITGKWTEQWVGPRKTDTRALHLSMPIYILTSERTYSAAEALAYNLQQLRNAVVIGDTTRGGAHTTRSFAAGNGFVAFIPFTRGENAVTKTDWEGIGVIPGIVIEEMSALRKAQELVLEDRLRIIRDSSEKRKLQWLLNDLKAQALPVIVPDTILKRYTGAFEEFLFTVEDGKLFCRNTHQRDQKDRLIAITNTLFKIDEQSQVEFIISADGKVNSIVLLWNDGWIDRIGRTKM